MRQLKYILRGLALLSLLIFNSCTNFDEKPYTFIDPDSFYKNEEQFSPNNASKRSESPLLDGSASLEYCESRFFLPPIHR